MPRFARLWMPGAVQHLIVRFVNRSYRMAGAAERAEYLRRLGRTVAQTDWSILAYALMSNHVHLCALSGSAPAAKLMQPLHGGFALWLNHRDHALGPVFATRFSAITCMPPHVRRLIAYIHNNPVRAGLVTEAGQSSWTSHRTYLEQEEAPPWLDVAQGLARCGLSGPEARGQFAELVRGYQREPRDENLSGAALRIARSKARATCGGPVELSEAFYGDGRPQHEVRIAPGTHLRPQWPGEAIEVLSRVGAVTGVTLERMQSREKSRTVCQARRLALRCWEQLGRSRVAMSTVLGLSAGAASNLVRRGPKPDPLVHEQVTRVIERCWAQTES